MDMWEKTKKWVSENRVASGAIAGLTAGTVVPGVGNVLGAIVGAGIGYASHKEKMEKDFMHASLEALSKQIKETSLLMAMWNEVTKDDPKTGENP